MIGQTISHYQIIEQLGEGGMGVVYVAQDTHLGRRVAIKFLASLDRPYRARFLREARAVSKLTHPNVAAVFDYGETVEGQPYIVMELVKGQTLHDLLTEGSLPLTQAIHVTSSIGEALGEAHQMGIIHRDVKPSNVVINERGQVKVLDFGLAKIIDEQYEAEDAGQLTNLLATRTQSSVVVGTPLYLSPEQATGKSIDGRSDLFALGAVLYECLTGQSAFSGASAIEIGAQIIHVDPPRPSSINRRVPSELDRITMKALQKNVDKRYQTAAELLADLKRVATSISDDDYRNPRARSASRAVHPSALTTIGETIRRPRLSIATFTIAILFVGLAVWALVKWWKPRPYQPTAQALDWYLKGTDALRNGAFLQASRALEEAITADPKFPLAHASLAEAWAELDYTDKAKDEMLRVSSLVPDRSLLPKVDALYLEALNATVSRDFGTATKAYSEIASVKNNEARAFVDLGRAYEKNDETDKAIENFVKATTLDPQYATAYLRAGVGYSKKGNTPSATSAFDKAETLFKALGNVEGVAEVFRQRGILFRGAGKFADSRAQFQQALETARATINESQEISTLMELSFLSFTEGLMSDAQAHAQQAVAFAQVKHLENLAAGSLIDLGNSYKGRGDYAEAEKYYKQALEFAENNRGRRREAAAKLNLGGLYIQQVRADEGLPLVEQALRFFEQGNYRRDVLICLTEIGRANRRKGNYEAAFQALERKLQLAQQTGEQPEIAASHADIGSVLREEERYAEALQKYDQSYAINKSLNRLVSVAYNQHNRANILWKLGRPDEAREALNEAFQISNQPDRSYKPLLPDIQLSYAQINLSERKYKDAVKQIETAISMAGNQYPDILIEAKYSLCLAQTLSGHRDGLRLCEEATTAAAASGDVALYSRAILAHSEAALEVGQTQLALQLATQAQQRFASSNQKDSEWRAWLIASRASAKSGDEPGSQSQLVHAHECFQQLEQKWGPEVFKQYLTRPDVQFYRKQLG
jgi:serine/threonine protein kinase/tetratricopeptide (TPR) repeat protein